MILPSALSLVLQNGWILVQPTSQTIEETCGPSQALVMLGRSLKVNIEISSQVPSASGEVALLQIFIYLSQRTSMPSVSHDTLASLGWKMKRGVRLLSPPVSY